MSRPTSPRRWNSLVLTAVTLAGPTLSNSAFAAPSLADANWAIARGKTSEAQIWLAAEGGEGGEAGAVADATTDVAYLGQLGIVLGHIRAARDLYAKGQIDAAIGLSYHPEAEMMDAVRETLTAHGVPDITPAMAAFSAILEAGAPLDQVDQAFAAVQAAVATATAPEATELRTRFDAVALLVKAAANEYAGSIENGAVTDEMAYHESFAFVATAQDWLSDLAKNDAAKAAADKASAALNGAAEAYGDMTTMDLVARDPAILAALAAKVELYASRLH